MPVERIGVGEKLRKALVGIKAGDEGRLAKVGVDQQHPVAEPSEILCERERRTRLALRCPGAGDQKALRSPGLGGELERGAKREIGLGDRRGLVLELLRNRVRALL